MYLHIWIVVRVTKTFPPMTKIWWYHKEGFLIFQVWSENLSVGFCFRVTQLRCEYYREMRTWPTMIGTTLIWSSLNVFAIHGMCISNECSSSSWSIVNFSKWICFESVAIVCVSTVKFPSGVSHTVAQLMAQLSKYTWWEGPSINTRLLNC